MAVPSISERGAGIFGGGAVSLGIQFPAQQGPAAQAGDEQGGQAGPALARPANRAAGMFVPIRTTREVSPLVQGIAPYQVRLERGHRNHRGHLHGGARKGMDAAEAGPARPVRARSLRGSEHEARDAPMPGSPSRATPPSRGALPPEFNLSSRR